MRTAAARRSPLGYGMLSHGDVDHLARGWVKPVFDAARRARGPAPLHGRPRQRGHARRGAPACPRFGKPVLLAWAPDDKLFPLELRAAARRGGCPTRALETIDAARSAFSMIDQPDRLARR